MSIPQREVHHCQMVTSMMISLLGTRLYFLLTSSTSYVGGKFKHYFFLNRLLLPYGVEGFLLVNL